MGLLKAERKVERAQLYAVFLRILRRLGMGPPNWKTEDLMMAVGKLIDFSSFGLLIYNEEYF